MQAITADTLIGSVSYVRIFLMNSMGVQILSTRCCRWRCQQTIEIRSWPRARLVIEAQQGLLQSGGWFR